MLIVIFARRSHLIWLFALSLLMLVIGIAAL